MACQLANSCTTPGFSIKYTMTSTDLPPGDLAKFDAMSSQFPGMPTGTPLSIDGTSTYILPCNVPAGFDGLMLTAFISLLVMFNMSPSRICGFTASPTRDANNILTSITFSIVITDKNLQSPPLRNDYLPAGIAGPWITDWLANFNANTNNQNPPVEIPAKYLSTNFIPLYTRTHTPSYSPSISKFTGSIDPILQSIEQYSGVTGGSQPGYSIPVTPPAPTPPAPTPPAPTKKNVSPSTLWEYIFQFAFGMSFIGAILISVVSTLNLNPADIVVNKNILTFLNVFIAASGVVSIFVWFNINNPILVSSALNPATVKTRLF